MQFHQNIRSIHEETSQMKRSVFQFISWTFVIFWTIDGKSRDLNLDETLSSFFLEDKALRLRSDVMERIPTVSKSRLQQPAEGAPLPEVLRLIGSPSFSLLKAAACHHRSISNPGSLSQSRRSFIPSPPLLPLSHSVLLR